MTESADQPTATGENADAGSCEAHPSHGECIGHLGAYMIDVVAAGSQRAEDGCI